MIGREYKLIRVVKIGSGEATRIMAMYRRKGWTVKKTKDAKAGTFSIFVKAS
jgi:hypothetical protein